MGRVRARQFPDVTFGAEIDGIGWVTSAWIEAGLPTCWWDRAPAGLATRRQLRELGLCPGGHEPVAALRRRPGGWLHAWLYRMDLAREKRTATPAVLAALDAALRPADLPQLPTRHRVLHPAVTGRVLGLPPQRPGPAPRPRPPGRPRGQRSGSRRMSPPTPSSSRPSERSPGQHPRRAGPSPTNTW